jgi:CRP-like cAMP-binding protein
MVAIKTLQRFPIFTNFSEDQLSKLVNVAREETLDKGQYICEIGSKLDHFYLISMGEVEVFFEVPKIQVNYESFGQPRPNSGSHIHYCISIRGIIKIF